MPLSRVTNPFLSSSGAGNISITSPAANTIAFTTSGTEDMRIDSSGNVMIGTTTSQTGAKLSVTGGIQGTITSGTTVASTSGTSIDFTNIPSWVKRITIMFSGVSTNGSTAILIQLGISSGFSNSGYIGCGSTITAAGAAGSTAYITGFGLRKVNVGDTRGGAVTLSTLGSNLWTASGVSNPDGSSLDFVAGYKTLADTLTQIRITTTSGTEAFDAGSINILYEG